MRRKPDKVNLLAVKLHTAGVIKALDNV